MTASRRHPIVRPSKDRTCTDAARTLPTQADPSGQASDFRFSLRAILIGMVLACLTFGAMRALERWDWETPVELPLEQRRAIYLELQGCEQARVEKDCLGAAAIQWGITEESARRIYREGARKGWTGTAVR